MRIIGGQWRSRKIEFLNLPTLRPTPNRVRETLFNWLAPSIAQARCLDLCAGSGALGFEALSRGADSVVLVDNDARVCAKLREQARVLGAHQAHIRQQEAQQFIAAAAETSAKPLAKTFAKTFNVVFLDPPFKSELADTLLHALSESSILNTEALVYLEVSSATPLEIAKQQIGQQTGQQDAWRIVRSGRTQQTRYFLLQTLCPST